MSIVSPISAVSISAASAAPSAPLGNATVQKWIENKSRELIENQLNHKTSLDSSEKKQVLDALVTIATRDTFEKLNEISKGAASANQKEAYDSLRQDEIEDIARVISFHKFQTLERNFVSDKDMTIAAILSEAVAITNPGKPIEMDQKAAHEYITTTARRLAQSKVDRMFPLIMEEDRKDVAEDIVELTRQDTITHLVKMGYATSDHYKIDKDALNHIVGNVYFNVVTQYVKAEDYYQDEHAILGNTNRKNLRFFELRMLLNCLKTEESIETGAALSEASLEIQNRILELELELFGSPKILIINSHTTVEPAQKEKTFDLARIEKQLAAHDATLKTTTNAEADKKASTDPVWGQIADSSMITKLIDEVMNARETFMEMRPEITAEHKLALHKLAVGDIRKALEPFHNFKIALAKYTDSNVGRPKIAIEYDTLKKIITKSVRYFVTTTPELAATVVPNLKVILSKK